MDPPPCVQNAMMTKDKKPFTYTPGGIDLSEARSPRLQRRIERNAHLGGAGDTPQQQPPFPQPTGPLPPGTIAAMRPQPQVQVFPSGPPPPMRGGAPPPPPPMHGIPPPPPPPSCPLPTQKVCMTDNQVVERPDMTKIIPDNPMALLRKTSGPQQRKSLVDQMFEEAGKGVPEPKSPPYQQQFQSPPQRIQSVNTERGAPISPVPQQTYKPPQQYQPQSQQLQQTQQQYQPPVQPNRQQPQSAQPSYIEPVKEQPRYQPPVIDRQPASPQSQSSQPELKTSTAHLGSLYIPPVNQQQQNQKRIVSPPTPPERNLDSPNIQTPPLKEAPRPWQSKKPQEEVPTWAKRDNQNNVEEVQQKPSPPVVQPQQRWPVKPNTQPPYNQTPTQYNSNQYEQQPQFQQQPQYQQQPPFQQQQSYRQEPIQHQQPIGVRIEIRTKPQQQPHEYQSGAEDSKPNVVYVTQPVVLQHPGGSGPQCQLQNQGPRVVPIQVEGARIPAGQERVLNRQQSWGSNPSQSNSFKIIQNITNTQGDDDYDNSPITEHSPKFPQNFQQPVEQMRRMKVNDEQNITNTFKQVSRGPQTPPQKGPQVRTIPIQIEGEDSAQQYVHPSEQVVQEPKKYTGSSIPSRSFKILQAMTAPDNCANVEDQNEEIPYDEWAYPTHYPPYPYPPYWYDYYHNYYYPEPYPEPYPEEVTNKKTTLRNGASRSSSPAVCGRQTPGPFSRSTSPAVSGRHTPVPYWGYPPAYYPPPKTNETGRSTPKPLSGYETSNTEKDGNETDESTIPSEYMPYYDPYYYYYYYGYPPPMYPRYPYYSSDTESSINEYSSIEEQKKTNKKVPETSQKKINHPISGKVIPTLTVKEVFVNPAKEETIPPIESSECETDTETDDEYSHHLLINPLKSMKSITNIDVYSSDEDECKAGGAEEYSDESNEDLDDASSIGYEEDQYPHQLSVILEESERAESRLRTASVVSDSTTLAERSDEDDNSIIEDCNKSEDEDVKNKEELPADIRDDSPTKINGYDDKCEETIENIDNSNEDDDKKSDESEDWWGIIGKEDDDLPRSRRELRVYDAESVHEEISHNFHSSTETIGENEHESGHNNPTISTNSTTVSTDTIGENENESEHIHVESEIFINETDDAVSEYVQNEKNDDTEDISEDIYFDASSKIENNPEPMETSTNEEVSEYKVILRKKKNTARTNQTEIKSRPRSIYESLEDIKTESTGSLVKVDNFVDILEQLQKDFGNFLNTQNQSENQRIRNCNSNRPVSMYEMTEDDKVNEKEKRFSYGAFEEFTAKQQTIFEASTSGSDEENSSNNRQSSDRSPETYINKQNTVNGSANYTKYNSSKNPTTVFNSDNKSSNRSDIEESSEDTDTSCSEKDEKEHSDFVKLTNESDVKVPSIQDRIQALRQSIHSKKNKLSEPDPKVSKTILSDSASRSKPASSKSSIKSFEELSEEEEVDSGVTSDMSRHISDTEEFPELKKLTRYQRAATHSRLFKLLQEECNDENEETENDQLTQRESLTLPLDHDDSKGHINEKLVNELVDSLLKLKKGQVFRNLPKEKLYAAAIKILQEDMELAEPPSEEYNSFLSPMRSSTGYSTAVQTPQEFGNLSDDYKQYYESWNRNEENCDVFPSKAFKALQDFNKPGVGKCPRVMSSKSIHKKLIKLLEASENPSSIPHKPPLETNEVTSVS